MRRAGLLVFGVLLTCSAPLFGQDVPILSPPQPGAPFLGAPVVSSGDCWRFWARADYLLWWVKNPQSLPLVTTGDPNVGFPTVNSAGAIDQPSTRLLFGGSGQGFGAFSGVRFTLGGWLNRDQAVGIEGTGFVLERRTTQFAAASDATGNPPIYLPAFNVQTAAERALAISDPLRGFSGDVSVTSSLQLWGAELNGVLNLWRRRGLDVNLLGGFRYVDLHENLQVHNSTNDLIFLNTTVLNDQFDTRNQFYGGQLGTRVAWQCNRLSADLTTKVALGATHQVVSVQGDITQFGPGAFMPGTFNGGFFAQPSNIGRRSTNEFTVIPTVELKLGYQITSRIRAFAGCDFLYWNQVVRPGNQIDRNVNQSQSPIFGSGALVGQPSPSPLFNRTDFWATGVTFGLQYRF